MNIHSSIRECIIKQQDPNNIVDFNLSSNNDDMQPGEIENGNGEHIKKTTTQPKS